MSIRTPVNLALLGDPEAGQYCEILDLSGLLGDLAVGCASGTAPTITTATLDAIIFGTAFSQTLVATGTEPITWSVSAGALPDGLNLSAAGELTGTPTASGAYDCTVQATNGTGSDTQQYTGTVGFTMLELFQSAEAGADYEISDLSNLYQDSAGTIPVTATGQPVGRIVDGTGNGNHATQSTAAARLILRQDGNGKYYLEPDAVDDALDIYQHAQSTPLTIAKAYAPGGDNFILYSTLGNASGWCFSAQDGSTSTTLNNGFNRDSVYFDGVLFTGTNRNHAFDTAQTANVVRWQGDSTTSLANKIGAYTSGGYYMIGDLYHVTFIARDLTAGEQAKVDAYLADKAGVTI